MKKRYRWSLLVSCLATFSLFSLERASAEVTFSAGLEIHTAADFYDPLASYGEWIQVGSYGRCWHPTYVTETGWRPYGDGHWEWTDCGWYWVSDEPWAWATYHYGYWSFDPSYGWIWVPGTEWAPAWVVWRESPDYVGWAPCGPSGVVIAPSLFCFVDIHHFHDRIRPGALIVNNTRIVERTRTVNGIRRESRTFDGARERVVVNAGPDVKVVQRATGSTFTARPVREVVRNEPLPQRIIQEHAAPWRRQNAKVIQDQPRTRNLQEQPRTRSEERQPQIRTGTEQPRSYEQQRTQPVTPQTPSGREQPRIYQQPERSTPAVPEPTRRPQTPTGPDERRTYERTPSTPVQPPVTPTPPERRPPQPAVPERPTPPATPPERPVPPTGRERVLEERRQAPEAPPRAIERTEPARPAERATEPERGRDRERDKP